jgi:DNA-binding NarL/FixJ family response regulator
VKAEAGSPLRVAVVEDHQLYREMLVSALASQEGIAVTVTAAGAQEARALISPGSIDVAVLDVELADGNGVALGIQLRRKDPNVGVMLLSSHDVMELLLDLPPDVRRGWSYLSKSSAVSIEIVTRALRATAGGRTVLDPELVHRAVPRRGSSLARLTPRQLEVLQLLATGLSNTGIAERLEISERSIENHLNLAYAALDLPKSQNSRVSAVLRFIEETSRG